MTKQRRQVFVDVPSGGWSYPWANVFELAEVLDSSKWTLIGGLMVHLHEHAYGIPLMRPTTDIDLLLHVEIETRIAKEADRHITSLGYRLQEPMNLRKAESPEYRFLRTSPFGDEIIDVMIAEHGSRQARPRLRNRPMIKVEAGTQALNRTMNYVLNAGGSQIVTLSVPDVLGALIMKCAAFRSDARDKDRHLQDCAALAACLKDPALEIHRLKGSDRKRIRGVYRILKDPRHRAWLLLEPALRTQGQDALRILADLHE